VSVPLLILLWMSTLARGASAQADPTPQEEPLVISRGEGQDPLTIPREEELEYEVEIDVGVLGDLQVGRVT